MTTTTEHRWTIAAIGAAAGPYRAGTADTRWGAWIAALTAGRTALLTGTLEDLAIAVDEDKPTAFYSPAVYEGGHLDEAAVTTDLVELHQVGTADDIAILITRDGG